LLDTVRWAADRGGRQDQVVIGQSDSLKLFAPLTGFTWRDDYPGGAQSMQWWDDAVNEKLSPHERVDDRSRLLQYNEDDVRAARHIRDWLDDHGPQLSPTGPSVWVPSSHATLAAASSVPCGRVVSGARGQLSLRLLIWPR
jgi:hypothetical protein